MSEELLGLARVTELLHQAGRPVTEQTVRRWCRSGELPATRIGHAWIVRRSDLEEFLKGGEGSDSKKVEALAA